MSIHVVNVRVTCEQRDGSDFLDGGIGGSFQLSVSRCYDLS
jgi:hypothetical protein